MRWPIETWKRATITFASGTLAVWVIYGFVEVIR